MVPLPHEFAYLSHQPTFCSYTEREGDVYIYTIPQMCLVNYHWCNNYAYGSTAVSVCRIDWWLAGSIEE